MLKTVIIHSDGACEGNPGPGGWAAVLEFGMQKREISGAEPATTNNRMELEGAIRSLRALKEMCVVQFHTDSIYVQAGITKGVPFWKRNQWRTTAKKAVKNQDLWIELDALAAKHQVTWNWVKGHAGHPLNERCDLLARQEILRLRQKFTRAQLSEFLQAFKAANLEASNSSALDQSPGLFR